LKNSYKPPKTLFQYNFLVPQMRRVLYYEEKLTPQNPPFPKLSPPFPSKLTNKASRRKLMNPHNIKMG